MNPVSIIAFITAFALIFFGISFDPNIGINLSALAYFIDVPSVIIVIFGSIMTAFVAFPLSLIKIAVADLKHVFGLTKINTVETVMVINDISKLARKNILGLEDALPGIENTMLRGGLRMVVDRAERSFISRVLYNDANNVIGEINKSIGMYRFLASISPAFGMVGTLIGLINLLQNLNDSSKVGPAMSVALITTFYGSIMSNILFSPIANKLTVYRNMKLNEGNMVIDAVMLIEKTERPEHIEQALLTYFTDEERTRYDNLKYGGG